MVDLEIDNKPISVNPGTTIIEAADQLGIYIPRFCYHKKLSIAANCRMCLVEVETVSKTLPACATPVTNGMKVRTISEKAVEAQRAVMEFLLINHPLDCPICDQGGECDLQDLSMGYGTPYSHYDQSKRAVFNEDIGPLIDTEMTRCIQCTRCVRFGQEIAGMPELGVTYRGEHEQIGTYVKHMMKSELSGNVIDLCPVGALTAKPSRYTLRGWELLEHPSIASHDCVGSHIFIHTRGQEYAPQRIVMRVVPRENTAINETWISDRDRFSYLGLQHNDRLLTPRVKRDGVWQELDWQSVLLEIADRTGDILRQQGANQIAALISPNATVEDCYLLQKWLRAMGSSNIDHRIRQQDFSDQHFLPEFPGLGMKITDIETLKTILLIGSDVRCEQPLIAHRFYKAHQEGAKIMALNPMDYRFAFPLFKKIIDADLVNRLAEIAAALTQELGHTEKELMHIIPSEVSRSIADQLRQTPGKIGIFIGDYAWNHPQGAIIRSLIRYIAQHIQATISILTEGANSAGAWLAGALPHRGSAGVATVAGANAQALFTKDRKQAYFLVGIEPEMDCAYPAAALETLQQANLVVCINSFITPHMEKYANYMLPMTTSSETTGTFVNTEGTWQSFAAVSVPNGQAKPAWKICRVLANIMNLPDFDYKNVHQIADELRIQINKKSALELPSLTLPSLPPRNDKLLRLAPWPIYRTDPLVRRAQALQDTMSEEEMTHVAVSPKVLEKYNLSIGQPVTVRQGSAQISLKVRVDDRLADNVVLIPSALEITAGYGQASAEVTLGEDS